MSQGRFSVNVLNCEQYLSGVIMRFFFNTFITNAMGLVVAVFLLYPQYGQAEGSDPEISVSRCPFGPFVIHGSWMPVRTRIENPGKTPRELGVMLEVPLSGRQGQNVRYIRKATVPAESTRVLESSVLYDVPVESLLQYFDKPKKDKQSFKNGETIERVKLSGKTLSLDVRLFEVSSGERLDSATLMGTTLHPETPLNIIVDGKPRNYSTDFSYKFNSAEFVLGEHKDDLSAYRAPHSLPDGMSLSTKNFPGMKVFPKGAKGARVRSKMLPARWANYEGVHALVLGSLDFNTWPETLTPQQRHSLIRWVRSGGRLVVMPAHNVEAYKHPFWQQLLPVRLMGAHHLSESDVTALEKRFGGEITFDKDLPTLMADAIPGKGKTLLKQDGQVLAAHRRVGGGSVYFMALPGGVMKNWSGGPKLWKKVLKPHPEALPGLKSSLSSNITGLLSKMSGAAIPERTTMMVILALYIGLSLCLLVIFKRKGRAEYAWAGVVVLAVVAASVALVAGRQRREAVGFVQGEIGATVLGSGESNGSVTSYVSLYSPVQRRCTIQWTNQDTLATAQASSSGRAGEGTTAQKTISVVEGSRFQFPEFRLQPGKLNLARAMTLVQYNKGVEVDAHWSNKGLEGYVVNHTGGPLRDCIVRANRRILRVGTLKNGERRDLSSCKKTDSLIGTEFQMTGAAGKDVRRRILASALTIPPHAQGENAQRFQWPVTFYGWQKGLQAKFALTNVQETPQTTGYQLIGVPVRTLEKEGDGIHLPAGTCGLELDDTGVNQLFGNLQKGFSGKARLPTMKRIAGMKRQKEAARQASQKRTGSRQATQMSQQTPRSDQRKEISVPGWNDGQTSMRGDFSFLLPASCKKLNMTKAEFVAEMTLVNFDAIISILNPETENYQEFLHLTPTESEKTKKIDNVQRYLRAEGKLPKFRVRFSRPENEGKNKFMGSWDIHTLDLKLWGTYPENARL